VKILYDKSRVTNAIGVPSVRSQLSRENPLV